VLRHYFPALSRRRARAAGASFAGLRVLPAGEGHAFHRSRETLLTTDRAVRPRLLSVYGGSSPTWRAVSGSCAGNDLSFAPARPARAQQPIS